MDFARFCLPPSWKMQGFSGLHEATHLAWNDECLLQVADLESAPLFPGAKDAYRKWRRLTQATITI